MEYRVVWCLTPHIENRSHVMFVEAENEEAAKAVALDHIERKFMRAAAIWECKPYTRPTGGRVLED